MESDNITNLVAAVIFTLSALVGYIFGYARGWKDGEHDKGDK